MVTRGPFCHTCLCQIVLEKCSRALLHQSPVAFAVSSPTFFGDRPSGPIFRANVDDAPISLPVVRRWMVLISLGSSLGGILAAECPNETHYEWKGKKAEMSKPGIYRGGLAASRAYVDDLDLAGFKLGRHPRR